MDIISRHPRPKAVLLDCDGTLVDVRPVLHHVQNKPKNFDKFHGEAIHCPPHQEALDYAVEHFHKGYTLLVVTARMQKWHGPTLEWLQKHLSVPFHGPFMRPDKDYRSDVEIKREIFGRLSAMFDIRGAIDDNPNIIELWKSLNLKVKQVERVDWGAQE